MGALPLRGAPTDLATSQRGTTYNYTYDSKGNATALEAKNPDGDMSLKSTAEYTSNGAFPAKTTDQEGIETTYNYDQNSGLLMSAQDSSTTTSYTYDENTNQLTSVTAEWDSYEDEYATNSYSYTAGTGRNLTQISHNGTNYNIEYDKFNNKTNSLVGNQSLAQYSYDSNNGILQSVTYGNGNTVSYAYDNYGNTSVQKYNGIEAFKWFSDRSGSVIRQSDFINQLETSYDYDTTGRLTRQTTLDTSKASSTDRTKYMVEYGYDLNNNITRLVNITPNGTKTFNYTYGKDNFLEKFTIGTNRSVDYTYDGLGRLTGSTITTARPIETSYSYKLSNRNSSGQTQYRTTKINNEVIDGEEYRYTYDDSGNITKIESVTVENGNRVGTTLYVYDYDSFGQLIYERDYIQNLSRHYDYDEGGNLLNETINYYDGSNGGVPTRTEDINYRYTDTNWTDKMTSYKGQTITYDEIGNPLTYRDGMTMTWQNGRQLASLQKGNNNIQYSYDSEGIRVSKTINGEKCTFEYLNGMLLYETRGDKYFHYYYDSNGMLCAVSYRLTSADDENIYYYTHNWRGDIVGIYTDAGDLTAKYTYDSWGNVTSITDGNGNAITSATHIGNLNPFRYRGYYMDTETGMYYLMSRYYDPVTHRFVNTDGYFQTGLGILDGNMNAYCKNNPIMNYDPTGCCYVDRRTNAGTYIGTYWKIITAVPGVPNFCNNCKQYDPEVGGGDIPRTSYQIGNGDINSSSCDLGNVVYKIIQSVGAVICSVQLDADIGFGFGLDAPFCDVVELGAVIKASPLAIHVDGYGIDFGNIRGMDGGIGLAQWDLFSTGPSTFYSYVTGQEREGIEETHVIGIGASAYFGIGGSFLVGWNLDYIATELNRIWCT